MRTDLQAMPIYTPPGNQLLNLANNENFSMPWPSLLDRQMTEITARTPLFQYGNSSHTQLIGRYAEYLHLAPEQVLPAPGSDSLIPLLINALTEQTVLTFDTDFFRYGQQARILKRAHIQSPITGGIDGLIETANTNKAELILFSNPNNPLGLAHDRAALVRLLEETVGYVAVDEAYAEYAGETVSDLTAKYPKLLVLRTMSKAWGLARLRVGFLVANAPLIQFIKAVQGPFVISDLNANIAAAALEHRDTMQASVTKTIATRNRFTAFLQAYPVQTHPSAANFVYIQIPDAKATAAGLLEDGMAVAVFGARGLRITIGTETQMETLQNSLAKHLPDPK